MRRAKLAPGSLPPGSLPSTTWYKIPRCFVCDETIKSHRLSTSLLAGRTQYSRSPLPTKIGGYIGDQFVVVVTAQDALCKHCMALINTMDRLEQELREHQSTLLQHLKTKYRLDGNADECCSGAEFTDMKDQQDLIHGDDEEWKPSKKQRTEISKQHRCTICNAYFTNVCLFMAHLNKHKSQDKSEKGTSIVSVSKASLTSNSKTLKTSSPSSGDTASNPEEGLQSVFKCGCCAESFSRKDKLAEHMHIHTSSSAYSIKPTSTHSRTSIPLKPETSTSNKNQQSCETSAKASTLFQDLDQLTQPDVLVSTSMCTEEQKGRVCLLALLNNGVCSDVSHRDPTIPVLVSMSNNASISSIQEQSPVTVTVSIPNDLNLLENSLVATLTSDMNSGGQGSSISSSPISVLPLVHSESKAGSLDEVPNENLVQLNNDGCIKMSVNQNLDKDLPSVDHGSSSLDMPDIGVHSPQDRLSLKQVVAPIPPNVATVNGSDWINLNSSEALRPDTTFQEATVSCDSPVCPSGSENQDMPNLLLTNELQIAENGFEGIDMSQKCYSSTSINSSPTVERKLDALLNNTYVCKQTDLSGPYSCHIRYSDSMEENEITPKQEIINGHCSCTPDQNAPKHDGTDNIAIVSVMSVQMNAVTFDRERVPTEWCYSNAEMVVKDHQESNAKTLTHQSWLDKLKGEDCQTVVGVEHNVEKKSDVSENQITQNGTKLPDSTSEQDINSS